MSRLNANGLGERQRRLMLLLLRHGFSLTRACAVVGLHRYQVMRWRKADAHFAREIERAYAEGRSLRDLVSVAQAARTNDMKLFVTNSGRYQVEPTTGKRVRNIRPSDDVAGELVDALAKLTKRLEKLVRHQSKVEQEGDPAIKAMKAYTGPNAVLEALERQRASRLHYEQDRASSGEPLHAALADKRRRSDDAVAAMTEFTAPDAVQRELQRLRNKRG